ncbi:hypothetical protein E2C01_062094 [Portunus trituberculatus]|uniref:PHD-type domain-containing protein n=1 Tax=Portunus trituberculatus TaxID=210409 RepID=A0A5B7HG55_PORTR|nr:hypothetical protein [Portunus trituberculatus]
MDPMRGEEWVCCANCKSWAHEQCAGKDDDDDDDDAEEEVFIWLMRNVKGYDDDEEEFLLSVIYANKDLFLHVQFAGLGSRL